MDFVHLHTHTPFSFLDGGSHIEDMVNKAAKLEMSAMAVTDHNNVCAAVKFFNSAIKAGIKPVQGTEITLENGTHLTLLARNSRGYTSICTLLSHAHLSNPRTKTNVYFNDLNKLEDVIVLSGCRKGEISSLILAGKQHRAYLRAKDYLSLLGRNNFYIELQANLLPGDNRLNYYLLQIAEDLGIEPVVTNNVHYAEHDDFIIHDLLTCIRTLSKVEDINPLRPLNGENYIKSSAQMTDLFSFCPRALENTVRISQECQPVFNEHQIHFPQFSLPPGTKANSFLHHLTFEGAEQRYGKINRAIGERLEYELNIINQMGFADYFLLVWDLVRFSRSKGIRYAGRGSAADSLVAYCLFITEVDSLERNLLFERFMSPERSQLPDIDIDFESRHREKVIEYVYQKYGADKVARVAAYNSFKARSALRDTGKALNFDEKEINSIAKKLPHTYADNIRIALETLPELKDSPLKQERFDILLDICEKIAGFPRFLGTHSGGLIISDCPLTFLTPLQRSALGPVITQFDKDDVEDLGLVKLDLLSLRTMSVVSDASSYIIENDNNFNYEAIPLNDRSTYEMISRGETIGVFQLESPAQRSLQCQLEANQMEDIIASMALIRPGPIKGNMVQPYIARRHLEEEVTYLHPRLEPILKKTYGVVLFQEQVIEIATSIAGFTPGEADQLRRVMTHARSQSAMDEIGKKFINRAVQNNITRETAAEIFSCIAGYASYGFCEAHAAAFAATSFKTAYLLQHYPAEYYTAILNNQPMGFYPPNIICIEARRRGIKILPPDINYSAADFKVEHPQSIRIGLKQVKGIAGKELDSLLKARSYKDFVSPLDLIQRTSLGKATLENLIKCGALDNLFSNRRQLLLLLPQFMEMRKKYTQSTIFDIYKDKTISDFSIIEKRYWEYNILGINIENHFMAGFRPWLKKRNIKSSLELKKLEENSVVTVCGMLLNPHRPPTRSGRITVFLSLADEYGLIDVTIFEDTYVKYGHIIFGKQQGPLLIKGILQKKGKGINIIGKQISFLDMKI